MRPLMGNVVVQFAVVSFVIMTAIGVAIGAVLSDKIRDGAISDLSDEAIGASKGRLLAALTPDDLDVPMIGERYEKFDRFVQQSIVSLRTARVKLWAKDGTIIYANDPAAVGERFPDKENLLRAIRGETPIEIEVPKDADHERERYFGTLMEVYTPIVFPGAREPRGVLEIYQYYAPTAERISELRRSALLSVGVGFLVLYGCLVLLVWRSQKPLRDVTAVGERGAGTAQTITG